MDIFIAFLISLPMVMLGVSWITSLYSVSIETKHRKLTAYQSYDLLWLYGYIGIGVLYSGLVVGFYNTDVLHTSFICGALLFFLVYVADKPLQKFYIYEGIEADQRSSTPVLGNLVEMLKSLNGWIYFTTVIAVSFISVGIHFFYNVWF